MHLSKVVVVYNPKGGSARQELLSEFTSELERHGIHVSAWPTEAHPTSANELARKAASEGASCVVPMGGDGTVRGVAEGLMGTIVPMFVRRAGTGNLFDNVYKGDLSTKELVAMLRSGQPQPVDAIYWSCVDIDGKTQTGISIVAVGFGCLLDAIGDADPAWKKRFGKGAYATGMVKAAFMPKMVRANLNKGDAIATEKLSAALVFNVPPVDMPQLARGCTASDGMLDFVGLRASNALDMAIAVGSLWLTQNAGDHIVSFRRKRMGIQLSKPVALNIDGDKGPVTDKVSLRVIEGAAQIVLAA
jgi:diacylglycerol kinase family enzyme